MKKDRLWHYLGLLFLPITVFAVGCGGGSMSSNPITVSVSPQTAAIVTGQTMQFTATTNDKAGVTWTASPGTIDANGDYTAPSGNQSATATVTATSKTDTTKSAGATLNVLAPGLWCLRRMHKWRCTQLRQLRQETSRCSLD